MTDKPKAKTLHFPAWQVPLVLLIGGVGDSPLTFFDRWQLDFAQQWFFSAIAMAFGLFHLILYYYARPQKSNLYFALFAIFFAANIFFDFQQGLLLDQPALEMIVLRLHRGVMPYNTLFLLLFLYALSETRIPRQAWILFAGLVITGIFAVLEPVENLKYLLFFQLGIGLEASRIFLKEMPREKDGIWIIAFGFVMLFLFSLYDMSLDFGLMNPIWGVNNAYPFGFLLLIISMSVYLARDFARANQRILEQERAARDAEMRQRLLEAEDLRKSRELEDARQLQLSMLPTCLNDIPGLDICFHMQTATEVGGDYYDYHYDENRDLTVVVGDATGHGMKAGIMVSIVKSLFIVEGPRMDAVAFFRKCTETIRQMKLGNLYMGLMIVKIREGQMVLSSAGMPQMLVYRAATGTVEEILIKGMPLGGPLEFPYQTVQSQLDPGDVLLLMSDGLAESFNNAREMFDYERIRSLLLENAAGTASAISDRLTRAGSAWRGDQPPEDDITFAVVKRLPLP